MRNSLLSKFSAVSAVGLTFLLPLAFLPFLPESFEGGKRLIVIALALIGLTLFAVLSFFRRKLVITRTPLNLGFIVLLLSTLMSIVVSAPNKMAALTGTGMFYIACALLYFLGTALLHSRLTSKIVYALGASGVIISILSALDRVGINLNPLIGAGNSTLSGIFPNGGPLLNTTVLIVALAATLTFFVTSKKTVEKLVVAAMSGLMVLGLLLNASLLLPGQPQSPVLMSFQQSWSIALDVLKNPRTAILGVGTESYLNAFSILRPVAMNQGEFWFIRYANARSFPLDIVVTHGIVGLSALALIGLGILALLRKTQKQDLPVAAATLTIVILFLLLPVNVILLALFTLLAMVWATNTRSYSLPSEGVEESEFSLVNAKDKTSKDERQVAFGVLGFVCVVLCALSGIALFFNIRSAIAKTVFNQSLAAIRANKAKDAYDLTRRAIQIAPHHEEFRRSFANTNVLIAQGLTQKKEPSEDDRKTALTLIQQGINEAKAAVALDPANVANWQTLATIYEALIGAAQQADQWTVAAYVQAIQRAPSDPKIRVDLAGVFRRAKNLDQATRLLEQAVQLKPDYANAYFNLADIAKEVKKEPQQLAYLDKTLTLIKQDDPQYEKIKVEADALRKKLGDAASAAATQTATPSATPKPTATPRPQAIEATQSATPKVNTPVSLTDDAGIASASAIPDVPEE